MIRGRAALILLVIMVNLGTIALVFHAWLAAAACGGLAWVFLMDLDRMIR